MVALRFYASARFQAVCADLYGISKASVSRIVYAATSSLVALSPVYIKFPSTDRDINNTILDFAHICNFPNVIGAIDGTHILIQAPSTHEYLFVNKKLSFNKCDGSLQFQFEIFEFGSKLACIIS